MFFQFLISGNVVSINYQTLCNLNYIFSIIIEADSNAVVSRVALRNDDIPIGEQTVAQVTNAIHSLFW